MKILYLITVLIAVLLLSITARAADTEPILAGVWSHKDPGGTGALFFDMTWDNLVSRWKELGSNQYLADVEVYRHNGQWRYAGLWRIGPGNGALYISGWNDFDKIREELKETQDLLDVEIFDTDSGLKYLGIWRQKQGSNKGSGAFFHNLTWEGLVAQWKKLDKNQYLSDVEAYVSNGKHLFAGVWRVGSGNGALYLMKDWHQFAEMKQSLNETQDMLDFEMFQTDDGQWNFLGVWRQSGGPRRESGGPGPLHASISNNVFQPLTSVHFLDQWKKLQATHTLVDIAIAVPWTALRGDTKCKYGDVDCNRCATNVTTQFKQAFEKGKWDKGEWKFTGNYKYPPDNMKPKDAFDTDFFRKHIQGFVRTNSSSYPYAGSHSHESKGSIFFVGVDGSDRDNIKDLYALHKSAIAHPGGVHVLGDYLYVAESNRLRVFRVSAPRDNQEYSNKIEGLQAGGGLGLAKLEDGTYLLVATGTGDGFRPKSGFGSKGAAEENLKPRYTRFFRLGVNRAGQPALLIQQIGEWEHKNTIKCPETPMGYSENLSLVTECGTGHLYTIHTTGQYSLMGDGYWRLSRVESGPDGPRLQHISIVKQSQEENCHHRSSATVHVSKNGKLEFLCSERAVAVRVPTGKFGFKEKR